MEYINNTQENISVSRLGKITAALGMVGILVGGCSGPEVLPNRPATVIAHEHHPGYFMTTMAGKVPITTYYPESFHLDVRQCDRMEDDTEDDVKDGCIVEHMTVSEETYNNYQDGDSIVFEDTES